MYLIKNYKTGKFYKTKYHIEKDRLCTLHGFPFVKSGVLTEVETLSPMPCMEKFPEIEVICKFDGRVHNWMRDCEWFTWLVVLEGRTENKN